MYFFISGTQEQAGGLRHTWPPNLCPLLEQCHTAQGKVTWAGSWNSDRERKRVSRDGWALDRFSVQLSLSWFSKRDLVLLTEAWRLFQTISCTRISAGCPFPFTVHSGGTETRVTRFQEYTEEMLSIHWTRMTMRNENHFAVFAFALRLWIILLFLVSITQNWIRTQGTLRSSKATITP